MLRQIVGTDLLAAGFQAIHAVGAASDNPPSLFDLTTEWPRKLGPTC